MKALSFLNITSSLVGVFNFCSINIHRADFISDDEIGDVNVRNSSRHGKEY